MKKDEILTLYNYNAWANARILNATEKISPEQFLAPASFSHGGLHSTLIHTLSAEWIWRNRWEGYSPAQTLSPGDLSTLAALKKRWQDEEEALMTFIKNVSEETLHSSIHYVTTSGKPRSNLLWHLMVHLVNHGTQHRSEAAAMLTDFGSSPGDIDLILFLRETN